MNDPDAPRRPDRAVPDPHAGKPHEPHEGMRPEADPSVEWPGQSEPGGPVAGLVQAAGAETAAHYGNNPAAAAIAEAAGVEAEGLEAGQLFGLMLATAISIIVLILTVYFLFYSPLLQETRAVAADVPLDRYVELRDARTSGLGLISAYAVNEDSTYRLPIEAAMEAVARDYAGAAPAAPAADAPDPRHNGLTWLTLTPPAAVRTVDGSGAPATVVDTMAAPAPAPAAADSL
jgi:hypothetical protein